MSDVDSRDFGARDLKLKKKKRTKKVSMTESKGNKSIIQPSRDSLI